MSKYILLDVNGTVGTDTVPILEKIENPDNFIWIDKVEAHIKLSTLTTIKRLCEEYDATVLWCSLRADDPLCLNDLIDVDWGWLDVNSKVVRSNEWSKTAAIVDFANEHPDDVIVLCDDMLRVGGALWEIRNQAPSVHTIIPSTTIGLTDGELYRLERILKKEQRIKHTKR